MSEEWITPKDLLAMAKQLRKSKDNPELLEKVETILVGLGYGKELEEDKKQ